MNDTLKRCLDDLEQRIDPAQEDALLQQWVDFTANRFVGDSNGDSNNGGIFSPRRRHPAPSGFEWPSVHINTALEDFDAMALQQFGGCSAILAKAGGAPLSVRSNYGSSIVPLLFGVKPFVMAVELETLPTSIPLNDVAAVRKLIDAGVPDLNTGFGARVFEMGERYVEIARQYPKIGKYVHIYHPDTQGPMDICEVIWGSSIFYALYDDPDTVKALLELTCQTYTDFLHAWLKIVPFRSGGNVHWSVYHGGNIMLRDDSAMNLSPAMFDEFIRPYDQRLLDEFGGGAIHFCGHGDHYIASMSEMRGLYGIAMSQPDYNDMEIIYTHTVDKGIKLLDLKRDAAEAAIAEGRDLHGQVHAW